MADIKNLIPILQKWEGGFANDPDDLGGATMAGITMRTFIAYRKKKGLPLPTIGDLKDISPDEWEAILKLFFWDKWQADQINNQSIANILVDWAFNSGNVGIKIVQKILGLVEDGIVGYNTLYAINTANQKGLFQEIKQAREQFYWDIVKFRPSQQKFIKGWMNRLSDYTFKA